MKFITYKQNGKSHTVDNQFQIIAPSIIWNLLENTKNPIHREVIKDIHGIICALMYGEVKVTETEDK